MEGLTIYVSTTYKHMTKSQFIMTWMNYEDEISTKQEEPQNEIWNVSKNEATKTLIRLTSLMNLKPTQVHEMTLMADHITDHSNMFLNFKINSKT